MTREALIFMIKLYKRTMFITEQLYSTSKGCVSEDLIGFFNQIKKDTDLLCDNVEILCDVLHTLKFESWKVIKTNADFLYNPIPKSEIKPNELCINIARFENVQIYEQITQLAFIYNNHYIRLGVEI